MENRHDLAKILGRTLISLMGESNFIENLLDGNPG